MSINLSAKGEIQKLVLQAQSSFLIQGKQELLILRKQILFNYYSFRCACQCVFVCVVLVFIVFTRAVTIVYFGVYYYLLALTTVYQRSIVFDIIYQGLLLFTRVSVVFLSTFQREKQYLQYSRAFQCLVAFINVYQRFSCSLAFLMFISV